MSPEFNNFNNIHQEVYIQNWDYYVPNTRHTYWDCCVPNTIHTLYIYLELIFLLFETWFSKSTKPGSPICFIIQMLPYHHSQSNWKGWMYQYHHCIFTIKLKRLNVPSLCIHIKRLENMMQSAEQILKKNSKKSKIKYITISDICILGSFNHHITS